MLDLSDGLAIDSARLARASGVGIDFASAALGHDAALALAGGEDHSLLATFRPGIALPAGFRRIGVCVEGGGLTVDGLPHDSAGWDPYRDWAGSAD